MTIGLIVALVLAIPVMLVPVALVWYINTGGTVRALREAQEKRAATETTKA